MIDRSERNFLFTELKRCSKNISLGCLRRRFNQYVFLGSEIISSVENQIPSSLLWFTIPAINTNERSHGRKKARDASASTPSAVRNFFFTSATDTGQSVRWQWFRCAFLDCRPPNTTTHVRSRRVWERMASWNIHADTAPWHRLTLALQNAVVEIGHNVFLT